MGIEKFDSAGGNKFVPVEEYIPLKMTLNYIASVDIESNSSGPVPEILDQSQTRN